MQRGIMIVLEGNDGAGKTTLARGLEKRLQEAGFSVLMTREPGGSPIAEKIRSLLLDPENTAIDPKTEALLYAASRRQHLTETIEPALEQGKVVLCDRFLDSSLAYQGEGRGLGMEQVEAVNDFGLEGFRPDLTLFVSVSEETGRKRVQSRGQPDRLDQEAKAFHARVRRGFEKLMQEKDRPGIIINGEGTPEQVLEEAWDRLQPFLSGLIKTEKQ